MRAAIWKAKFDGHLKLTQEKGPASVLRCLTEQDMRRLLQRQIAHLLFLFDSRTTRADIVRRARQLGQVHALTGVSAAWLSRAQSLYRQLLAEHFSHAPMLIRERLRTLHAAETRLQADIQAELDVETQTTSTYLDVLATALPPQGTLWADASEAGIEELGRLPGMQAALLMRLMPGGTFAVEGSAGPQARLIADLLQTPGNEPVLDPASPHGQALTARAWRSLHIETSAALAHDTRYAGWGGWPAHFHELGIRSAASIPVLEVPVEFRLPDSRSHAAMDG